MEEESLEQEPLVQQPLEQEEVEMETPPELQEPPKPQVPQELEIWCLIVGMVGTAFPVVVKGTDRVWELQKTIKNEAVEILGDFNAAQLRLFLAKKEDGRWLSEADVKVIESGDTERAVPLLERGHLASMSRLATIFDNYSADAVHILVPAPLKDSEVQVNADIAGKRKRSEQTNEDVETMQVAEQELATLFGVLGTGEQPEQKLIPTSGLAEFWKGYGGFPSAYFVRKEAQVLWRLVIRLLSRQEKKIVLTGSLGVGKSCFMMLVSFYLAFAEKRKVLVVRRLKGFSEASSVVFLDGENNTCIRKTNLSAGKISSLPDRKEFKGSLILIDGYSEEEVDRQFGLLSYQLLVTSGDFEDNDSLFLVVLPAWRYDDLLHYAELTIEEWKMSTGFNQVDQEDVSALASDQYFYSGGNLRDFCRSRDDVRNGMDGICGIVTKAQTVDLDIEQYELWDRIRGHYVIDANDEEHYVWVCHYVHPVDSGYAYKRIGRFMDVEKCLRHCELSQKLSAGFWGAAFEQCFHMGVREATRRAPIQMVNVVVNFDPSSSNQRYDRIELYDQAVEYEGETFDECIRHLTRFSPGTYWLPDSPTFPFVDAVVACEAVLRGSDEKEVIIAIISTTVSDKKSFQPDVWAKLNKALDDNESISNDVPRVLVLVGPDASTCKRLTLSNAPAPDEFMVCCFDPLKFLRRSVHARIA